MQCALWSLSACPRFADGILLFSAVVDPRLHQRHSLVEQVAASIGRFYLAGQTVSQRVLAYLARKCIADCLGAPVAKRSTKAVHRDVTAPHAPQDGGQPHVGQDAVIFAPWEDEYAVARRLLQQRHRLR